MPYFHYKSCFINKVLGNFNLAVWGMEQMVTAFGLNHRVQHRLKHRPKNSPSMQNMGGVTEPVLLRYDYYEQRIESCNFEILTQSCLKAKCYKRKVGTFQISCLRLKIRVFVIRGKRATTRCTPLILSNLVNILRIIVK